MDLVADTKQSITCCIVEDSKKFFFSAIYGCNEGVKRKELWAHLQSLSRSVCENPWMFVGDFNIITQPSESSHEFQIVNYDIRDFVDCKL